MALAGDWGTGTDEAARIAELIKKDNCEYTIHLGDVYYVGDEASIAGNCRGIKQPNGYDPVKWQAGTVGSFALNGNHEAYARDCAYFRWIQGDDPQPHSSCFCLFNDHWCVIGLDTGYNSEGIPWLGWLAEQRGWPFLLPSCKLPDAVMDWLGTAVQPALSAERGIVLLSHHQYVSAFDNEYPNAARQLARVAQFRNRDLLWLWGHEHRLAAYNLYSDEGIRAYGRCLGHGGMPVDRGEMPKRARPLQFYDDRSYDPVAKKVVGADTVFGVNGYAVMEFYGPGLKVTYKDISGAMVVSESWSVSNGNVVPTGKVITGSHVKLLPDGRLVSA